MDTHEEQGLSPLTLFYCYADQDEKLREKLEKHLSLLQQQRMIAGWHHHKIMPGADRNQVSEEQLSSAQIILLLISPDFLASNISHMQMQRALQLHEDGLAHVIPLLLRPADWEQAPFAHLQALPRDGKPVTTWRDRDLAFVDIAKGIRSAIEQWNALESHSPPYPFLFLSSAQKDLSLVNRLKDDLPTHGMMRLMDHKASSEEEDQREAIRNASAVILVASPHTRRSRSVRQELHIAEIYQRPIYLFWMQGDHLMDVMPTGKSDLPSFDARTERYPQALQDLLQALEKRAGSDHLSEQPPPSLEAPRNPYKGLQAFGVEDAQDFFGRDRLIDELLEKVRQLLTIDLQDSAVSRLLTVLGPSGSGKSSVVMAGLIPKLKQGTLSGSQHWIYLDPMVPGKHPLEALTLTLAPLFPERGPMSILEDLKDDSARGLHLLLTTYAKQSGVSVLLVIDQLEELFTQTATEDERQQFLDLLLAATSELHGPLIAVLTLRADFYDRPLQHPELGSLIKSHQVIVFPMEIPDLRKVIERPAQLPNVQLTFEEDLVGDLLFDVQGQAGALPLLQFTLHQLFQHRQGPLLTQQAYQKIGGVKGALVQHAESTYQSLPTQAHQRLARTLFLRLINLGTVGEDVTKRRAPRSELVVTDSKKKALLVEVTNAFTKACLLTANTIGGVSTIEVSHEALIRAWTRLKDWLREAPNDIHLQQAISSAVDAWEQRERPKDRLYHGSQLKEARAWATRNEPSEQEAAFLSASVLRQVQRVVSMIMIFLLLVSTASVAVGFFLLLPPDPTHVTNLKDDGPGSLRWAIERAGAGSTIKFASDVRGTIWLRSNHLVFSRNLIINGPGADALTISSGNSGRSIVVLDGNDVTISGLSFKDSNTRGGFLQNGGTLTLTNMTVSGNTSSGTGGGIFNTSKLTLINSTVSSNRAQYGGGIYNYDGTLTVINSTIWGNKAIGRDASSGGGILDFGLLTLTNSTVSGNATSGRGGGITVFGSQAAITFCTIYDNTAQDGGGLSIQNEQARQSYVKMEKSIVAENHAPIGADISGILTSGGYNLIQDVSQASLLYGDSARVDPIGKSPSVGPLQNNGGPTKTHALAPGSPAVDKIPPNACHLNAILTDQRGMKRPQGPVCDIGAYEYVPLH